MSDLKLIAMVNGVRVDIHRSECFVPGQQLYCATIAAAGRLVMQPCIAELDMDAEYDGWTLRRLLQWDAKARHDFDGFPGGLSGFTPAQREAISAHWSAKLRAKVAAAKQKEREQVVSDYDEDRP